MTDKKIAHCGNSSNIQLKIVERVKIDTSNRHILDRSFSSLGTGTSIKGGEVILAFYDPKTSPRSGMILL